MRHDSHTRSFASGLLTARLDSLLSQTSRMPSPVRPRAIHLLEVMDTVESFESLKRKGFRPSVRRHSLTGSPEGEWTIDIHKTSGWRITFRFEQSEFIGVKVEDYH